MKWLLLLAAVAAACQKPEPTASPAPPAPNAAVKYVGGLQNDLKAAQDAAAKASSAVKKEEEAGKVPE